MNETMQNVLERNIKIYKKNILLSTSFYYYWLCRQCAILLTIILKKRLRMFSIRISAVEAAL
jgi:hypothetical protein